MRDAAGQLRPLRAAEAVDLFVYRISRELGSLAAALGGLDALVFTGGIGENAAPIRARVCRDASWLGLELDEEANARGGPCISRRAAASSAWVIPTDEESMIALHTRRVLESAGASVEIGVATMNTAMDQLCVNTIRTLAMDAVQQANSGHPGAPMALAPVVYCLWQRFLRFDPNHPIWPSRDRFVLSAGHASMLLYAMLHLTGVKAVNKRLILLAFASLVLPGLGRPTRRYL